MQAILSLPQLASVVSQIPQSTLTYLEGQTFFPNAIAPAFISALDLSFYIGAALSIAAAVASLLRGKTSAPGSAVEPVAAGLRPGGEGERCWPGPDGRQAIELGLQLLLIWYS